MSTGLAWQIPYEHLGEFSYLFRKLRYKIRSSKTVCKYFAWYYSIQDEFEKNMRFSEEEYKKITEWLALVTSEQAIKLSIDIFSVIYSIQHFYKYRTRRSWFMESDSLIERFLKRYPYERYISED